MNPNFVYHEQQQHEPEHDHNIMITDALHAEELYFADYDHVMALEANYFEQQHNDDNTNDDDDDDNDRYLPGPDDNGDNQQDEDSIMMNMETAYNYQDDTLLKLIVDVQSYLSESNAGVDRNESPLVGLQYKMYIYLKQRISDMGMDINSLM